MDFYALGIMCNFKRFVCVLILYINRKSLHFNEGLFMLSDIEQMYFDGNFFIWPRYKIRGCKHNKLEPIFG